MMEYQPEIRNRAWSTSKIIYKSKYRTAFKKSQSESILLNQRKVLNGRITASIMLVCQIDGLIDICDDYNRSDRSMLFDDRPYKICGLTMKQVRRFPFTESNFLTHHITPEMEDLAKNYSSNYRFGRDFIIENSLRHGRFTNMPDNLGLLCEIVIPNGDKKYPNIDLTTVTEKTEDTDKDIIYTAKRGMLEEVGINLFSTVGKKIFHPVYQENYRKKYYPGLPYNFSIGMYGKATECIVVGANPEDLIECQIYNYVDPEERQYQIYEQMIDKFLNDLY